MCFLSFKFHRACFGFGGDGDPNPGYAIIQFLKKIEDSPNKNMSPNFGRLLPDHHRILSRGIKGILKRGFKLVREKHI